MVAFQGISLPRETAYDLGQGGIVLRLSKAYSFRMETAYDLGQGESYFGFLRRTPLFREHSERARASSLESPGFIAVKYFVFSPAQNPPCP